MNSELKPIFGRDVSPIIERYIGDDFYLIRNGGPELYDEYVFNTKQECIDCLVERVKDLANPYYVTGDEYGSLFYIEYISMSKYTKPTIDVHIKLFWKGKEYDRHNDYNIREEIKDGSK